ncbi:hypothetical protein ES705_41174 [subsurface metagenome]
MSIFTTKSVCPSTSNRYFFSLSFNAFSAFLPSVISSPELKVPVIFPSLSLMIVLCHAIMRSSPFLVIMGFSKYSTGFILPVISLLNTFFTSSDKLFGKKLLNQFFPIISFCV